MSPRRATHGLPAGALNPFAAIAGLWGHRGLISALARREVQGRYRGSVLGIAWSAITPLFMLAIYTFVFSVVFQSRWGQTGSRLEFALILFLGILLFNIFGEVVMRAPSLITVNANYVKKVVFPLEVLPCVALGTSLFHGLIAGVIWVVAMFALGDGVPWTVVYAPIYLLPLLLVTLGACWFLAALGVYLRDIGQVVSVAVTALLFLSPIFFAIEAVPEQFRPLIRLNPIAHVVEGMRGIAIFGTQPDFLDAFWLTLVAFAIAWAGYAFFQATRRGFADVL